MKERRKIIATIWKEKEKLKIESILNNWRFGTIAINYQLVIKYQLLSNIIILIIK